jgi:hypothetical protein
VLEAHGFGPRIPVASPSLLETSHKPVSREFAREWQFNGLATIRSSRFPPRSAPNSIRRPWGVTSTGLAKLVPADLWPLRFGIPCQHEYVCTLANVNDNCDSQGHGTVRRQRAGPFLNSLLEIHCMAIMRRLTQACCQDVPGAIGNRHDCSNRVRGHNCRDQRCVHDSHAAGSAHDEGGGIDPTSAIAQCNCAAIVIDDQPVKYTPSTGAGPVTYFCTSAREFGFRLG